jgi:DNA-binding CsgD family transcriptional regulator
MFSSNQKTAAAAVGAQAEYRRAISTARHAVVRAMAEVRTDEEKQLALRQMRSSQKAWSTESRYQIVLMSIGGMSPSEIAAQLGLCESTVKNMLSQLCRERTRQAAEAIDAHRAILLSRAEMIVEQFAPLALDKDLFERIERGEPVSETAFRRAYRSALVLLAVCNFECRVLGLFNQEPRRRRTSKSAQKQPKGVEWIRMPPLATTEAEEKIIFGEIPTADHAGKEGACRPL